MRAGVGVPAKKLEFARALVMKLRTLDDVLAKDEVVTAETVERYLMALAEYKVLALAGIMAHAEVTAVMCERFKIMLKKAEQKLGVIMNPAEHVSASCPSR